MIIFRAVILGMLVMLAGTLPRNILFLANLRHYPNIPWAVPVTALYLWIFWRHLRGEGPPPSTADHRRHSLGSHNVSYRVWAWALLSGGLGIISLVLALHVANRLVVAPQQYLPDELTHIPRITTLSLLLAAAPIAGIIEEAAFRGYMQGPIESRHGVTVAIAITGTMFAVAHLDFTLILWPYYVAVAAIYGVVTSLTNSIRPSVVLHTAGNLYSNLDLWLHGKAEWQASSDGAKLIWQTGTDRSFWMTSIACAAITFAMFLAYCKLAKEARQTQAR